MHGSQRRFRLGLYVIGADQGTTGPGKGQVWLGWFDGAQWSGFALAEIGGVPANFVASWDGSTWQPLGSGVSNVAFSVAASPDGIYLGGWFYFAGNTPSAQIAFWSTDISSVPEPVASADWFRTGNPYVPGSRIQFVRELESDGGIDVFDNSGRRIRILHGDRQGVSWDGRMESGRSAPSGLYFLRAHAPNDEAVGRITLIR